VLRFSEDCALTFGAILNALKALVCKTGPDHALRRAQLLIFLHIVKIIVTFERYT
jgi:hypothetical protein